MKTAEMIVTRDPDEVRLQVRRIRQSGQRTGCVPTMGALHAGHVSLIDACRQRTEYVVVTIFVNPTQFGPQEDLSRYPRPLQADLAACRQSGADLVFLPETSELYPVDFETWVTTEVLSTTLEGAIRPGHFRGVTTVVAKLFNIVQPDVACFGAKDYQQQSIIRRMVRDLNIPVEIVVCPTVREPDGLALSSRNIYLNAEERRSALALYESLQRASRLLIDGTEDIAAVQQAMLAHMQQFPHVTPEYAIVADADSLVPLKSPQARMVVLIAARVGNTRLIDNMSLDLTPNQAANANR